MQGDRDATEIIRWRKEKVNGRKSALPGSAGVYLWSAKCLCARIKGRLGANVFFLQFLTISIISCFRGKSLGKWFKNVFSDPHHQLTQLVEIPPGL